MGSNSGNHRIVRWCEEDAGGSMVAGVNDDSGLNQLHSPYGLTFDSEGNLYVADHGSDRIIKYKKKSQ